MTNESRILKETLSIIEKTQVSHILVLGFWKGDLLRNEKVYENVSFVRINCYFNNTDSSKFLRQISFVVFYFRCFLYCIRKPVRILNCHALTVLPLCVVLKIFKGAKLIYDTHELETETNGSVGYRKKISKVLEKKLIVHSDFVLTVSDSICDWYKTTYNLENIAVLKNIPAKKDYGERKELKKILEITEEKLLFIYQGYLTKSRGVLEILEAFESLDSSKHILFMGFGPLVDKIIARSNKCSNIHFIKGVSPKEVLSYTAGADIGIHIILNTCLNHYYCLPNKVFEYASAGIPFIASNFPDLRSEFEKHNISWFGEPSAQGLVKVIGAITLDDFNEKKKNSMEKRNFWSWEIQEHFLQEVYLKLLETNSNNCD